MNHSSVTLIRECYIVFDCERNRLCSTYPSLSEEIIQWVKKNFPDSGFLKPRKRSSISISISFRSLLLILRATWQNSCFEDDYELWTDAVINTAQALSGLEDIIEGRRNPRQIFFSSFNTSAEKQRAAFQGLLSEALKLLPSQPVDDTRSGGFDRVTKFLLEHYRNSWAERELGPPDVKPKEQLEIAPSLDDSTHDLGEKETSNSSPSSVRRLDVGKETISYEELDLVDVINKMSKVHHSALTKYALRQGFGTVQGKVSTNDILASLVLPPTVKLPSVDTARENSIFSRIPKQSREWDVAAARKPRRLKSTVSRDSGIVCLKCRTEFRWHIDLLSHFCLMPVCRPFGWEWKKSVICCEKEFNSPKSLALHNLSFHNWFSQIYTKENIKSLDSRAKMCSVRLGDSQQTASCRGCSQLDFKCCSSEKDNPRACRPCSIRRERALTHPYQKVAQRCHIRSCIFNDPRSVSLRPVLIQCGVQFAHVFPF